MPSQLSGGQQQRIALARAIVIEPDVLLMDEPLSALDENLREEMRREVDNLQRILGVTTLFVTHDQREALSLSDKIVVMKDGEKQQEGTPEEVYNYPINYFVADFIGHSNFFEGVIEGMDGERATVRVDDGTELLVEQSVHSNRGERVTVIVRAQKFDIRSKGHSKPEPETNYFEGRIKDRSYMGGEVRYFVELENGTIIHVIGGIKERPFSRGEEVSVQVAPGDCRLVPNERGQI